MFEIRVKFKSGAVLKWKATEWIKACELQKALEKKYPKALTTIWKVA